MYYSMKHKNTGIGPPQRFKLPGLKRDKLKARLNKHHKRGTAVGSALIF